MSEPNAFSDLMARVRSGDERAAAELVARFEPQVRLEVRVRMRLQDSRLRRIFDSTDVSQAVMASFFTRYAVGLFDVETPQQLQKLLVKMAQNKLLEQVRFQQRGRRDVRRVTGVEGETAAIAGPTPSHVVSQRDLVRAVSERLTDDERRVVELRTQGREWGSIAEQIGGTPEGRRKQYARAIDRVMRELGAE